MSPVGTLTGQSLIPVSARRDRAGKRGWCWALFFIYCDPGPQEAQAGHMPNSPGGQLGPGLTLTSLPAPLAPLGRYIDKIHPIVACIWERPGGLDLSAAASCFGAGPVDASAS
uniref:Uncharacterized protein n=1 Tax=Knipowitschia caucasica TaxID=637954 RepID=A0AAV2L9M9_KNICA